MHGLGVEAVEVAVQLQAFDTVFAACALAGVAVVAVALLGDVDALDVEGAAPGGGWAVDALGAGGFDLAENDAVAGGTDEGEGGEGGFAAAGLQLAVAEEAVLAAVAEVLQAEAGLAGFELDGGDAELELGGDEFVVFFVQADLAVDVLLVCTLPPQPMWRRTLRRKPSGK